MLAHPVPFEEDNDARSQFGTRQYWNEMYSGLGDFPPDEFSWYYGWDEIKSHWTDAVPSRTSRVLIPGVGNDPIVLDLYGAGYTDLTAFDYSVHAIERQEELLSYDVSAAEGVTLCVMDGRELDEDWTDKFDAVLEKGALDAIYLSGDANLERAVRELERVLRPGGICVSISGVVPEGVRRDLFGTNAWTWMRDGANDLKAGLFVLKRL